MAAESVRHFVFSSTCATYGEPIETPIAETHPQQPINSYGETKLAVERALPHFERAHGIRWVALRYFNAAGADPDGEIGEDHSPEIHLIPRAHRGGDRRPRPAGVRRRLPDAGRHLPARLHPRHRPRRRARPRARGDRRDRRVRRLQPRHRPPHSVREVIDTVERVTGPTGAVDARRRGGPAIRPCCTPRAQQGAGRAATGRRASPTSSDRPHRLGLAPDASARLRRQQRRPVVTDAATHAAAAVRATRRRIAAGCAGRVRRRWSSTPSARPASRLSSSRSSTTCCRTSEQRRARSRGRSSASTCSRASARTSRPT